MQGEVAGKGAVAFEPQAQGGTGERVTAGQCGVADFFGLTLARGETLTLRLDARYRVADGRIAAIRISARE